MHAGEEYDYILNFEKVDNENNEDLPPKLKQSIKDIVKKEGFINGKIDIKCISGDGGNFLARLFEIHVDWTTKDGRKEIDNFVKHIVPKVLGAMFSITEAFRKELYFYTNLLKIYEELQIEAGVPVDERFKVIKSYEEKKKQPAFFDNNIKCLESGLYFNDEWKKFIENFTRISIEILDDEMKNKVEKIIPLILEKLPDYHLNTNTVCCLCHGDFRANNVMVKMNEDDGIKEVIMIDYQIIQYSSPINDLLYFIFGATDQQFRRDHLEDIKDAYYDTLGDFLKYFDLDVNNIFSRKTFDKLYKERLDYGLLTAIWILPIILTSPEDIPDFSQKSSCDVKYKTHINLKERLEGLLNDYIEWGYL